MLARTSALILLAGICCADAAEPKVRPRLPPGSAGEEKREASREFRSILEPGNSIGFRSFDDYLQAESRKPVGLDAFREPPEIRAATDGTEKNGPASADPSAAPSPTDPDILVLPKVEITAERIKKQAAQLAALSADESWETKSAEAWEERTVLDSILNPPFLRLGGYSANAHAAAARRRADLLHWVRVLVISLEVAKTPAEKARIQGDIDGIKDIMRQWP